ncbi:MAG TPA: mechanosensitive ion channel domain-containing protein [Bacteroidia bacterium]
MEIIKTLLGQFEQWIEQLIRSAGVRDNIAMYLRLLAVTIILVIIAFGVHWIGKRILAYYYKKILRRNAQFFEDLTIRRRVFNWVSHIFPVIIINGLIPQLFRDFQSILPFVTKCAYVYTIIVGLNILLAFLKVLENYWQKSEAFKDKPLTSYSQLMSILLYIAAFIFILSIILDQSPIYFLSAFGAMTALLLLIFKDTILGLVASVQMSANDMVRIGDWVEMPKFNADGNVIAINLNTVKVRNFDKTITTIPTYYFITDSFKNWRGMVESGGRRIKRSIYINVHSIRFVDPELREKFKKFYLVKDYIVDRQKEIEAYNASHDFDTSELINGRRMTNIGVYRKYVENYLKKHPRINKEMIIMVRQLSIEDKGVPLEIYCFANTTVWVEYESIQADIFDHLLAATRYFDLDIYQQPSGQDISGAIDRFSLRASANN